MLHIITHYYCTAIVQYAPVFGRLTGDLASNPFDYLFILRYLPHIQYFTLMN